MNHTARDLSRGKVEVKSMTSRGGFLINSAESELRRAELVVAPSGQPGGEERQALHIA